VRLGNHPDPLRFVVDSAAGATVLDAAVARRHDLLDSQQDEEIRVQGASAKSAILRRLRPIPWHIGSLSLTMAGVQTDLSGLTPTGQPMIDGILGNDITRRWDTRWDFAKGQFQLWPSGSLAHGANCQANAMPDRDAPMQGFGFLRVRLGESGIEAMAVVDTGAAQSVLNMAAATALGLRTDGSDKRVSVRGKGTSGLGDRAQETWLYEMPGLSSGRWRHPAMQVRISALPVFAAMGLADSPAMILGADAMAGDQLDVTANAERICLRGTTS